MARGRGPTCQWNAVALLSNLGRRWRADDSRELQGGVEEDRGEARFDGPPAALPLSASPTPAPARADKTAGGPKRIRRETEISSSWRQTRAVGHLLPVGLAPLEILGLQQPTPFFMGHPFCPLDCAYRLGALELVSAWYPSISCGPHPSAEVLVACPSAERACRCAPHHGGPRRLLLEREAPCR